MKALLLVAATLGVGVSGLARADSCNAWCESDPSIICTASGDEVQCEDHGSFITCKQGHNGTYGSGTKKDCPVPAPVPDGE